MSSRCRPRTRSRSPCRACPVDSPGDEQHFCCYPTGQRSRATGVQNVAGWLSGAKADDRTTMGSASGTGADPACARLGATTRSSPTGYWVVGPDTEFGAAVDAGAPAVVLNSTPTSARAAKTATTTESGASHHRCSKSEGEGAKRLRFMMVPSWIEHRAKSQVEAFRACCGCCGLARLDRFPATEATALWRSDRGLRIRSRRPGSPAAAPCWRLHRSWSGIPKWCRRNGGSLGSRLRYKASATCLRLAWVEI